jgi:hypothetical protein
MAGSTGEEADGLFVKWLLEAAPVHGRLGVQVAEDDSAEVGPQGWEECLWPVRQRQHRAARPRRPR